MACTNGPYVNLKVLSEDQVSRIHQAATEVLERIGVQIKEPLSLKLPEDAGFFK